MNSNTSGWLVLTRNFVAGSHPQNDSSDNLYAVINYDNAILRFAADGTASLFASGLNNPNFIAIEVPEPTEPMILGLGALALLFTTRRKA